MEKKYLFRYASVDGLILSSITVAMLLISPLVRDVTYVGLLFSSMRHPSFIMDCR